jgi:enoyl-CoA hydratase/carnithine racemase
MRAKVTDASLRRKMALEGHRFTPSEAEKSGIVDYIVNGNTEAVVGKAEELASSVHSHAQTGVWGLIKVRHL